MARAFSMDAKSIMNELLTAPIKISASSCKIPAI